ncbi:MAG: hypothetical protein WB784_00290 [Rhodanobacteraceae bacterium]
MIAHSGHFRLHADPLAALGQTLNDVLHPAGDRRCARLPPARRGIA